MRGFPSRMITSNPLEVTPGSLVVPNLLHIVVAVYIAPPPLFVCYLWMGADSNRRYMEPAHHSTPELPTLVILLKMGVFAPLLWIAPNHIFSTIKVLQATHFPAFSRLYYEWYFKDIVVLLKNREILSTFVIPRISRPIKRTYFQSGLSVVGFPSVRNSQTIHHAF